MSKVGWVTQLPTVAISNRKQQKFEVRTHEDIDPIMAAVYDGARAIMAAVYAGAIVAAVQEVFPC